MNLHVQCTLGLDRFLLAAVANQSAALGQAEVESQQGTVLHADSPQSGTINLYGNDNNNVQTLCFNTTATITFYLNMFKCSSTYLRRQVA